MKRSRLCHGTGLLATASLSLLLGAGAALTPPAQPAQADLAPPSGAEPVRKESPSRAEAVTRAQRELDRVSELHRQGRASADELLEAKIGLAEARLRLSPQKQDRTTVAPELETLVTLREERLGLATASHKAGVTSSRDLNAARIALAEARIRLELNRLIAICAEDLAAAQAAFEAGIATEQEVAKARQALAKARQRLAANRVGPH